MASKYSRFTPIFAEWGALGSFVLLGDIAAQNLEHHFKDPKLKPSPVTAVPTAQAGAPITPENVIPFSSLHSQEHICKKEDMHHSITAFNSDDGDDDFHLDYTRLSAAACTGLMWVAPICMLWFPFLHRFMGKYFSHLVEGSFRYVSFKVILENACLAAPVCVGYFAIPAMIEGGNEWWSLLVARLQTDFVTTLTTDVSFWCVASPFNYKFIPVRYQPVFSCILGGVEAAALSIVAHRETDNTPDKITVHHELTADTEEKDICGGDDKK